MAPQPRGNGLSTNDKASPVQGLWNIFISPADAFTGGKRAWLVPLVATMILATITSTLLISIVGLETITRSQLESNPRIVEQLGQERIIEMAREAAQSQTRKILSYAVPVLAVPTVMLIVSGVLLGIYMMTGSVTHFASVFTATAWSWYAVSVISLILTAIVLVSVQDFEGLDFQNLVALNPTVFVERDQVPKPLYSVLGSPDLLSFYAMFLLALGVTKLSRGLGFGKSLGVVVAGWLVWVVLKAGFSMFF